ncbi:MAG: hypothetical protein ACRDBM_08365 [Sporomusa sp.]
MKSVVTEYTDYCTFCGKPREAEHHLLFGCDRKKADEDHLTLPVCNNCHNTGKIACRIHGNSMAEKLSKIAGQLAYEKRKVAEGMTEFEAREDFRRRYYKSYL